MRVFSHKKPQVCAYAWNQSQKFVKIYSILDLQ